MPSADLPAFHDSLDISHLDNLAWHALTGPHRPFAEFAGRAARYQSDVSIWAATDAAGVDDPPAWEDLVAVAGEGGVAAIFRANIGDVPAACEAVFRSKAYQMIAPDFRGADPNLSASRQSFGWSSSDSSDGSLAAVVELGDDDGDEMVALARLTEPGPFSVRTHQLGRFVGVRNHSGQLVAMAGERFRSSDWVEISAVCTHPDARGQGLAAAVTIEVARNIQRRGAGAILHVQTSNVTAKRLYVRLGFIEHQIVDVVAIRAAK